MVDSSDKRDFRRMNVEIKAVFKVNDNAEMHKGVVDDLSATGLRLLTDEKIALGDTIEIRVKPEKVVVPPLHAMLKVLRIEDAESGARFSVGCEITEML